MNDLITNKLKRFAVLIFFTVLCYLINAKYDILGLFIDDLTSFTYFPGNNIFEYAFKFYDNATRYRPFYEFFQYIAFFVAGHNPHILYVINIIFNGFIAYYLFFRVDKIFVNKYLSFIISILYLITHFACYQITQATGLMENIATLLSLMILFQCIDYVTTYNLKSLLFIDILYLFVSFTHERYMSLFALIVMTLFVVCINNANNDMKKNIKISIIGLAVLVAIVVFIIFIRYMALGRFVPAGTSGTYVIDTFTMDGFLNNIKEEILYVLGMNVGNEAMSGILYESLDARSKTIIVFHIVSVGILSSLYIIGKIIKMIKQKSNIKSIGEHFYVDVLFLTLIMLTIAFSSVTIYIEKRFILVPFISIYIYILYIINQLYKYYIKEQKAIIISILIMILSFGMVMSRFYIENRYRKENDNTYFMVDQRRLNSLAKETVYKYGNTILDEKQVYIVQNSYLYTDRYLENFFTIYQKNYEKRPILILNSMNEEQLKYIEENKSIILVEDKQNDTYIESKIDLDELLRRSMTYVEEN